MNKTKRYIDSHQHYFLIYLKSSAIIVDMNQNILIILQWSLKIKPLQSRVLFWN